MHRESFRPRTKYICYTTNAIHVHERRSHDRRLDIFKSTCMTLRRAGQDLLYLFASNTSNNILSICIAGERVHLDGVQDKRFFFIGATHALIPATTGRKIRTGYSLFTSSSFTARFDDLVVFTCTFIMALRSGQEEYPALISCC